MKPRDAGFSCSRRTAFRLPLQEARAMLGALSGKPPARLSELAGLPDESLATIRPVLNQQYEILIRDGWVCARLRRGRGERGGAAEPVPLFAMERENLLAYNLWNGLHDLAETAEELAAALDWPEERAFAHARTLFLSLAERLVMVPENPPAGDG